jgi:hypothetical protein
MCGGQCLPLRMVKYVGHPDQLGCFVNSDNRGVPEMAVAVVIKRPRLVSDLIIVATLAIGPPFALC